MSQNYSKYEALAIAYLTGQATAAEVSEYRSLYAGDAGFKEIVDDVETWLAPLKSAVPDQMPPDGLLDDIMSEIARESEGEASVETGKTDSLGIKPLFLPTNDTETLMALLSDASQPELMAIVYNPKNGKVVARLSNITVPDDGDFQLWLIREGEAAPVSLGVLSMVDEVDRIELLVPLTLRSGTDTLAISLEEKGGSKSVGPEGPVLYTGAVSNL